MIVPYSIIRAPIAAMQWCAQHGGALLRVHDYDRGIAHIDEAIALNPNHGLAFLLSGIVRTHSGDIATALVHLERARRVAIHYTAALVASVPHARSSSSRSQSVVSALGHMPA